MLLSFHPCLFIGFDDKQQGPFAPWALLHFIATTSPAVSVSPSVDFPVLPVIRPPAPSISRWGEDGFSSCLACPCHRAVPNHPAGVSRRISQIASRHVAFARQLRARPPGFIFFEATIGSLALRPGDSLTILIRWLCRSASSASFPSFLRSKLRGSDSYPDGTFTHCSCQPSLDARFPLLIPSEFQITSVRGR